MGEIIVGMTIMCVTSLFFAFVFGFFAYLRYLKHKETLALAEKGLIQPEPVASGNTWDTGLARWAILLIALGAALCIGLYPIGWIAMPGALPLNFGPWMIVGLLPLFFGIGLLMIHLLPTLQVLVRQDLSLRRDLPTTPARREQIDEAGASVTPVTPASPVTTVLEERKE
jgi:hypothetical protein